MQAMGDGGEQRDHWKQGTGTESHFDGKSVRWLVVDTRVTDYAGAYAVCTYATQWLGRGNLTLAPLGEEMLEPVRNKDPRTTISGAELLVTPHCHPDLRCWRIVTVGGARRGQELLSQ